MDCEDDDRRSMLTPTLNRLIKRFAFVLSVYIVRCGSTATPHVGSLRFWRQKFVHRAEIVFAAPILQPSAANLASGDCTRPGVADGLERGSPLECFEVLGEVVNRRWRDYALDKLA